MCIERWANAQPTGKWEVPGFSASSRKFTAGNQASVEQLPGIGRNTTFSVVEMAQQSVFSDLQVDYVLLDDEECNHKIEQQDSGRSVSGLENDFMLEDPCIGHSKTSDNFDFGVYLEYWRHDRKNSIIPKYRNLKEELMNNRHSTITEQQYAQLMEDCEQYLNLGLKANDIGICNKTCKIPPGSLITIEHLVVLKLYTGFTNLQREFKRHCRRLHKGESVESVMDRNREIAHWSRLLRESIMFWGNSMAKKEEFYCGLSARLLLRSLKQRFECPLSTTKSWDVAQRFTGIISNIHRQIASLCTCSVYKENIFISDEYKGMILKIKRANTRTRYFDVAAHLSVFNHEEERLFIGSSITITGIFTYNGLRGKWESLRPKNMVSALAMLQQIYSGHFVDGGSGTRALLLELLYLKNNDVAEKRMLLFWILIRLLLAHSQLHCIYKSL